MAEPLLASTPLNARLRAALPAPMAALTVRLCEGLRVLALRHLAGADADLGLVLSAHGMAPLPKPGSCLGVDPWLVWAGPAESLLLTSQHAAADGVLQALAPGRHSLACAVDQSAAYLVFELIGPGLAHTLPRLFDASAIPQHAGQASRTRFMDISAMLVRLQPERALLAVDRTHAIYAAQWLAHALQADAAPVNAVRQRPQL